MEDLVIKMIKRYLLLCSTLSIGKSSSAIEMCRRLMIDENPEV